jgi:hypothetical protein
MTRPSRVLKSDIERVAQALKAVGENVSGVEIQPNGAVRILTGPYTPIVDAPRKGGIGWDDFTPSNAA